MAFNRMPQAFLLTAKRLVAIGFALLFWTTPETATADTRYPGRLVDHRVATGARNITEAWLADATTRYRHFVLGSSYEAASLMVRRSDGRILKLTLPEDQVFEDRQPRLADLVGDGRDAIVLVRSTRGRGAALVVVGIDGDTLKIIAETPPTGRENTWLNPAGIADFDGDGRLDIAYVQMPHVLGRLRVWTLRNGALVEIATAEDTSNHVIGSPALGLSAVADFDGDGIADLAVPTRDRRALRLLSFKGGGVREFARVLLEAPAVGDFKIETTAGGRKIVHVPLDGGRIQRIER